MIINDIDKFIAERKKLGFVELDKLTRDVKLEVKTRNSTYTIIALGDDKYSVQGGTYYPNATDIWISGATWGGSMLWIKKIGVGMNMEMQHPDPIKVRLLTSPIESIKILGANYEYILE